MAFFTGLLTNLLVGFVSAILLVFNTAPINTAQPKVDLTDYELTFADEFDGDSLNLDNWYLRTSSRPVRRGGYWSMDQAQVSDGNLIITTEYKADGEHGPGWYTAGITTEDRFEQKYGYYECRCILPEGNGLWSAFWLTNDNVGKLTTGNAKKGAEIDVFESPYWHLGEGRRNKVTSNIHYNGYELLTRYKNVAITKLDNDPYKEYNTYGMLWDETGYTYYINGYKIGHSAYGGVSQVKEYMLLSCEVEGAEARPTNGWSGTIESNDKDSFRAEFKVDYVRVYQKKKADAPINASEIIDIYKTAAEKTDKAGAKCKKTLSLYKADNEGTNFDKYIEPKLASFADAYTGEINRITGDYMNLSAENVYSAEATNDGKYTTVELGLRVQPCSTLGTDSINSVAHGIDIVPDVNTVLGSLPDLSFDFTDGDFFFTYSDAEIVAKIDNETGLIVSADWSYRLYADIADAVVTGPDFTEDIEARRYIYDYKVNLVK